MRNTRIRVPATAAQGDIVEIRAMIMHPMDNGFTYTTQGTVVPVNIVTDFRCTYLGEEVLHVRLEPGISANPYFSFRLRAVRTGKVEFAWLDQDGETTLAEALLTVT